MALTNTWDATVPADSRAISSGAGDIRNFKLDVTERYGIPVDDYADLATALTAIGSTERVLLISEDCTVAANMTIPATCKLVFLPEAKITVNTGVALTVNSDNIDCGDWSAFVLSGTGTVVFAAGAIIRSTWFATIAIAYGALTSGGVLVVPSVENDTGATSGVANDVVVVDYRSSKLATASKNKVVFYDNDGVVALITSGFSINGTTVDITAAVLNQIAGLSGVVVGLSDTQILSGKTIDDVVLTGSIEEGTYTLSGTALDPANGTVQTKTLAAAATLTDSLTDGESLTLHTLNGDTYEITWPTISWVGGIAPVTTASDVFAIWKIGSTLYGSYIGEF